MRNYTTHSSRREFLGLVGMGLLGGSLVCIGGMLGYLAQDRLTARSRPARPSMSPELGTLPPTAERPTTLKRIDRPTIQPRAAWNARAVNHDAANETGFYSLTNVEGWREYEADLRHAYQTLVVHHSVLYGDDDASTMLEIQNQHMDMRRWADIGYHFGVGRSGAVYEGRALKARGTHVEGYNTGSVGVVFLGNFEDEVPSPTQIDTGRQLINWLALRLELTHLAGHRNFNDFTECPGAHMLPYLVQFADSAGLTLGTSGYQPPPEQRTPQQPSG